MLCEAWNKTILKQSYIVTYQTNENLYWAGMLLHVHKLQVKDMIDKAAAENEGCEKLPLVRLKVS